MRIWTENEQFEVDANDISELKDAMRFKAHEIKAKADPELFQAVADAMEQLDTKCSRLERERDAAIEDLSRDASCFVCKHVSTAYKRSPCGACDVDNSKWEWRGVQDEL